MERNRRNKRYNNNWNNQKNSDSQSKKNQNKSQIKEKSFQFNQAAYENVEADKERIKAIQEIKSREVKCPVCGQLIADIASAINDKNSGTPVHFECVLNRLAEDEKLNENEKIAYIGQGRFGVLHYENIRDQKHFTIKKVIEVEDRDNKPSWRNEISELYSKVN